MPTTNLAEQIFQLITEFEPVTTTEIQQQLKKYKILADKQEINSALYGELRDTVIRDVNEQGVPAWRIRRGQFSAAGGLETKFFNELIKKNVVTRENAQLGFTVKNTRNNKRYHLDIAIRKENTRYNIEIDGFDHVRADAMMSIQRQMKEKGRGEIEIDWMDNTSSYAEYASIDTAKVHQWCAQHIDWCIRYHEELLWPKDITRNIWLIDKGWKIIRFWNVQIRGDMQKCIDEVHGWIKK